MAPGFLFIIRQKDPGAFDHGRVEMTVLMESHPTHDPRVDRAREGDRAAFDELTTACRDRLATLVRFRLGDSLRREVDPEDILQETYLRFLRSGFDSDDNTVDEDFLLGGTRVKF